MISTIWKDDKIIILLMISTHSKDVWDPNAVAFVLLLFFDVQPYDYDAHQSQ